MIKNLFWNPEERRLRMLWRIILQAIFFFILTIPFSTVAGMIGSAVVIAQGEASMQELLEILATQPTTTGFAVLDILTILAVFAAMVISIWLAGRFLDRRPFANFGLHLNRNWWIDLGFGLLLGAVLMSLIFLVELAAGWITISGTLRSAYSRLPFALAIGVALIRYLSVGIYEELFSRGYQLKNMAEGFNFPRIGSKGAIVLALLISSAVFGIIHLGNPNATAVSTFNIFLAGIFLALGYLLTGELAIPIGLHITWNFFQGNVFGFPVSGTAANATSFIAIQQGGNALITGGAFGPEAGLVGVGAMILGCGLIVWWVRMRYGRVQLYEPLATPHLLPQKQTAEAVAAGQESGDQ